MEIDDGSGWLFTATMIKSNDQGSFCMKEVLSIGDIMEGR